MTTTRSTSPRPASSSPAPGRPRPASSTSVLEDPFLGATLGAAAASRRRPRRPRRRGRAGGVRGRQPGSTACRRAPRRGPRRGRRRRSRPSSAGSRALESFATGVPVRQTSIVGVIVPGAFRLAAQMLRDGRAARQPDSSDAGNDGRGAPPAAGPGRCAWCRGTRRRRWPPTRSPARSPPAAPTILKPSEYAPYGTTELARVVGRVLAEAGVDPRRLPARAGRPGRRRPAGRATRGSARSPSPAALAGGRAVAAACAEDFNAAPARARRQQPARRDARRRPGRRRPRRGRPADHAQRPVVPGARPAGAARGDRPTRSSPRAGPARRAAASATRSTRRPTSARWCTRCTWPGSAPRSPTRDGGRRRARTPAPRCPTAPATSSPRRCSPACPVDAAVEEIFGPVATVHTYATEDEALALANGTPYGLEGYVSAPTPTARWRSPAGSAPAR